MSRTFVPPALAFLAATGLSFAQDPAFEEEESSLGARVAQSASWSEDADPAWYHATSASVAWMPAANELGVDELRAGVDLIGSDFQFDSLWALEPNAGISWSRGIASVDVNGWGSLNGGDSLTDMGADAELSFLVAQIDPDLYFLSLSGSISDASGSEAGVGARWSRTTGRYRFDAGLSATRKWEVDLYTLAQNMPRRVTATSDYGDQWVFGSSTGVRILLGDFSLSPRLSASAIRSELETSRMSGRGKRSSSASMKTSTTSLWSLDATPTVRLSWSKGPFDVTGTLGSTSSYALSSKGETEPYLPWGSVSMGLNW